jgi:hypothetical protein
VIKEPLITILTTLVHTAKRKGVAA